LAALTGDPDKVMRAVSLTEWTLRVVEFGNLISSSPHTPEGLGPAFNIFGKPIDELFMESLEGDFRGLDQRPLDVSISPVLNNSENPVTAPGKAASDATNTIDNVAEPSTGANDTSTGQGEASDSETDETSQ